MTAAGRCSIVVLASGNGSNFQAILDAVASGALDAHIAALVTDQPAAFAIERARTAGIPALVLARSTGEARPDYDRRLAAAVAEYAPDVVVLAGWMRILTMSFLSRFPRQVINLHPALPGEFPGTRAIERALDAARAGEPARTGVMVHFVPDEGVDDGPVIATVEVPILPGDTLDVLSARVHTAEHRLLIDALRRVVALRTP